MKLCVHSELPLFGFQCVISHSCTHLFDDLSSTRGQFHILGRNHSCSLLRPALNRITFNISQFPSVMQIINIVITVFCIHLLHVFYKVAPHYAFYRYYVFKNQRIYFGFCFKNQRVSFGCFYVNTCHSIFIGMTVHV